MSVFPLLVLGPHSVSSTGSPARTFVMGSNLSANGTLSLPHRFCSVCSVLSFLLEALCLAPSLSRVLIPASSNSFSLTSCMASLIRNSKQFWTPLELDACSTPEWGIQRHSSYSDLRVMGRCCFLAAPLVSRCQALGTPSPSITKS